MKIGLISDTHNNLSATIQAASLLLDCEVAAVLHCGDITSARILEELYVCCYEKGVPLYFVWGNCDCGIPELLDYPTLEGLHCCRRFGALELGGKRIGLIHGDDARAYAKYAESGAYDYLISGHTHVVHDQNHKKTRLLNPGSAAKSRGGPESCAVLDLDSDTFQVITIDR